MSDSKKRAEEDGFVDFGDFDSPSAPPPPPSADGDFPFEDLPSPASARASGNAKPFDDFADLSGGGQDEDDDPFGSASDPVAETPRDDFGEEEEADRRPQTLKSARATERVEPSFDDEPFEDAGTDEPSFDEREFNGQDGDELDETEEGDEPVAGQRDGGDRKHQLIRYAVLGGMGLAGLFVTWIGYSTVIKPFLGEQPAQVASGPMVPTGVQPNRPASTGTLPPLGAGPSATVPPPSAMPPRLPAPAPTPAPTAGLPQPSVPAPPATPVAAPSTPQIPTAAPVRPAAVDPALADRLARVESQIQGLPSRTDMEQRIKQLEERLARYENRAAPAAPRPEVQVPMKPQVIDGWTLQGVNRDTAWLKGPNGIVEVREDSDLGGNAGKVTRIQRYQNSWIVVTTTGVIMRN